MPTFLATILLQYGGQDWEIFLAPAVQDNHWGGCPLANHFFFLEKASHFHSPPGGGGGYLRPLKRGMHATHRIRSFGFEKV